ncbi:MAG: hydroxymethylpyrimidine/phosphomethylpyrimidine kinase [Lentimonas sp.]|jgi:hydroxymethylpyrimidine/phosphomethylpyrimidine kinase
MDTPPYVLTISGSDSSGRAGMQTDNRAIHAVGAFPLNVVTAVTLQSPTGVESIQMMDADFVEAQLRSILKAYRVRAIKSGMLGNTEIVRRVAQVLAEYPDIPYVLDPVLRSTSGAALLEPDGVAVLRSLLMPRATVTTPNLDELEILCEGAGDVFEAAAQLASACRQSILVKGGHATGPDCEDWLFYPDGRRSCFCAKRIKTRNTRGTGCALSALIAAYLAWKPDELEDSIAAAKDQLAAALREHSQEVWKGGGPNFY